jgi:hypothetical protein
MVGEYHVLLRPVLKEEGRSTYARSFNNVVDRRLVVAPLCEQVECGIHETIANRISGHALILAHVIDAQLSARNGRL